MRRGCIHENKETRIGWKPPNHESFLPRNFPAIWYVDALHQARANEKQSRQLANLHGAGGTCSQRKETGKETEKEPDEDTTKALPKEETSQVRLQYHKCRSTRHLFRIVQ